MDTEAFVRDGYVVVRGAFGEDTARACRKMIWDVLAERGIDPDDRATWAPPLIRVNCPEGAPFAASRHLTRAARRLRRTDRRGPVGAAGRGGRHRAGALPVRGATRATPATTSRAGTGAARIGG